jgi:hypothetical protein
MIGDGSVMRLNRYLAGVIASLIVGACSDPGSRPDAALPTGGIGGAAAGASGTAGSGAAVVCDDVDGGSAAGLSYVDMNVTASGFGEHEGQTILLVTRGGVGSVFGSGNARVTGGAFALRFAKGYLRSIDQEILWLIDANGDGVCSDGEHTGFALVSAVDPAGPLEVAITDNHARTTSRNVDICTPTRSFGEMLDMNVTGRGFEAHDGMRVRLLTRTNDNGAVFGFGEAVVAGGGFALHFPRGFERFTYQEILLYVDVDGDGACATETDHSSYLVTSAFNPVDNSPLDQPVLDDHMAQSARGADVCAVMNGCHIAP